MRLLTLSSAIGLDLNETPFWLSGQEEPDIDQLVLKVEQAMRAYTICKDRLDKVQATLGQYFQRDGAMTETAPSADGNGQAKKSASPASEDENIPF
jgi:exodeoxyribonuclease VII small subunit